MSNNAMNASKSQYESNQNLQAQNSSLIVRVKRKRNAKETDIFDQICVIEDVEPAQKRTISSNHLSKSFAKLSTNQNDVVANSNNFVILTRVNTINKQESSDKSKIDINELIVRTLPSIQKTTPSMHENVDQQNTSSNVIFIPNKKRVFHRHSSSTSERFLVVDMTQVEIQSKHKRPDGCHNKEADQNSSLLTSGSSADVQNLQQQTKTKTMSKTKTLILDPATRQLNGAILLANTTGDFNGIVLAISHGACINHRTSDETGGLTALMVAVKHGNFRMVKRLLSQGGCHVFITNTDGDTAMDLARKIQINNNHLQQPSTTATTAAANATVSVFSNQHHTFSSSTVPCPTTSSSIKFEIQQWLHRSALRQHNSNSNINNNNNTSSSTSTSINNVDDNDDEYVYDIYHSTTLLNNNNNNNNNKEGESYKIDDSVDSNCDHINDKANAQSWLSAFQGPIVPVDGLKINDDDNIELVFEYDSDWSALAGARDDDSDSNDENNPKNDYPEEEEEEEDNDSNSHVSYDDDQGGLTYQQDHGYDSGSDSYSNSNSDNDHRSSRHRERMTRSSFATTATATHTHNNTHNTRLLNQRNASVAAMAAADKFYNNHHHDNDDDHNDDYKYDLGGHYHDIFSHHRHQSVSSVLRPQTILYNNNKEGDVEDTQLLSQSAVTVAVPLTETSTRNTQHIQRIWGEEYNNNNHFNEAAGHDDDDDNDEVTPEHQQHNNRMAVMRHRTGMEFASVPREFEASGLARYGAELQDDYDDELVMNSLSHSLQVTVTTGTTSTATDSNNKPSLSTVAYDSDLDHLSD